MIGANWKMHKNPAGTDSFFEAFRPLVEFSAHCEIVICPSFLDVAAAVAATRGTRIHIGAQDLYWEAEGAFTGEVSGPMIRASGCSHVIVGHSERRRYFGETNESVLKKTVAALEAGLTPIVCIGESEKKNVEAVLTEQFRCGIGPLSDGQFARILSPTNQSGRSAPVRPRRQRWRLMHIGSSERKLGNTSEQRPRITFGFYMGAAASPTMRRVSWLSLTSTDSSWAALVWMRSALLRWGISSGTTDKNPGLIEHHPERRPDRSLSAQLPKPRRPLPQVSHEADATTS